MLDPITNRSMRTAVLKRLAKEAMATVDEIKQVVTWTQLQYKCGPHQALQIAAYTVRSMAHKARANATFQ